MTTPFGARLKELREAAGLSQPELAEKVGMSKGGIAHLEQGWREPSWKTVRALAKALGVTCLDFDREPTTMPEMKPGRPRKELPVVEEVKRPRGRPRKER